MKELQELCRDWLESSDPPESFRLKLIAAIIALEHRELGELAEMLELASD